MNHFGTKTLRLLTVLACSLSTSLAMAFGVPDHRQVTEIALEELSACKMLPNTFDLQITIGLLQKKLVSGQEFLVYSNVQEDNYLQNGIKKTFEYSHFYNPFRPLAQEAIRNAHADEAVIEYTNAITDLLQRERTNENKVNIVKHLGMISHMVQDASSPLHVLWINHAFYDGFENKVPIEKSRLLLPAAPCKQISLAGLSSPMDILKSSAISTMKEIESEFEARETTLSESRIIKKKWSEAFFSNPSSYSNNVLNFLKSYDHSKPNLNTPQEGDNHEFGWDKLDLPRGQYGFLTSEVVNPTVRGDYFSYSDIKMKNATYRIEKVQYEQLRIKLLRQSVLNTQRLILWLAQNEKKK